MCTANPGVYGTGFNDRGAETMMRWFDMANSLTRPEVLAAAATGLSTQLDPQSMIDAFVRIAEEDGSKFRNVVPDETAEWIKELQAKTWDAGKDDAIWSSPPTV